MGKRIKHMQRDTLYLTQYVSLMSCTAHVITWIWQQYVLCEIQQPEDLGTQKN